MMDTKFLADTKMADSKRELEMQKASFNQEVNTKVGRRNDGVWDVLADPSWLGSLQKAEAQLAYELQAAKEQQKIRMEEIEIEVVQRKKQIAIEEKEIERTDKELIAMVKRPAEAEAYKMQQLAEGHKWVVWHPVHSSVLPLGHVEMKHWVCVAFTHLTFKSGQSKPH